MEKDFLAVLTHLKTKYGVILEPYPSIPGRIRNFLGGSSFGEVETGGLGLRMKESMGDLGMVGALVFNACRFQKTQFLWFPVLIDRGVFHHIIHSLQKRYIFRVYNKLRWLSGKAHH
jgi:hypothetical protein